MTTIDEAFDVDAYEEGIEYVGAEISVVEISPPPPTRRRSSVRQQRPTRNITPEEVIDLTTSSPPHHYSLSPPLPPAVPRHFQPLPNRQPASRATARTRVNAVAGSSRFPSAQNQAPTLLTPESTPPRVTTLSSDRPIRSNARKRPSIYGDRDVSPFQDRRKKQRTDATIRRPQAIITAKQVNRKTAGPKPSAIEVLEISDGDDDEIMEIDMAPIDPIDETQDDSEDDWDNYHAGYTWPEGRVLVNTEDVVDGPTEYVLDEVDFVAKRLRHVDFFPWDPTPDCVVKRPLSKLHLRPQSQLPFKARYKAQHTPLGTAFRTGHNTLNDSKLELVASFRRASGAVGEIAQKGGRVAVASSAIGGTNISWAADQRNANVPGALLCWRQDKSSHITSPSQFAGEYVSHYRDNQHMTWVGNDGEDVSANVRIHYSVNDVKFHPLSTDVFTSCSYDKTTQTWTFTDTGDVIPSAKGYSHKYPEAPMLLDYQPGGETLAVGCMDGITYIHFPTITEPEELPLQRHWNLTVTCLAWGPQHSSISDCLFVGGGTRDLDDTSSNGKGRQNKLTGAASGWKVRPDNVEKLCDFIMGEGRRRYCECLSVCPTGDRVAVTSTGSTGHHTVYYYDVRAGYRSFYHQTLPAFSKAMDVISTSFSPDGVYFATAREDNVAHVWDSRFMGHNATPLRELKHGPPPQLSNVEASPKREASTYGIAAMKWVDHNGAASAPLLVTGGDDGKIIQWDMRSTESHVLAELETAVGCFTLGDIYNGEMPLIAGDCDAKLYIYDQRGHFQSRRHR